MKSRVAVKGRVFRSGQVFLIAACKEWTVAVLTCKALMIEPVGSAIILPEIMEIVTSGPVGG